MSAKALVNLHTTLCGVAQGLHIAIILGWAGANQQTYIHVYISSLMTNIAVCIQSFYMGTCDIPFNSNDTETKFV